MMEILLATVITLLVIPVIVGAFPIAAIRAVVRLYPKGHPRRDELIGEVHVVPRKERIAWVGEQLALASFEGIGERGRLRRERRREVKEAKKQTNRRDTFAENIQRTFHRDDKTPVGKDLTLKWNDSRAIEGSGSVTAPAATARGTGTTGWVGRPHDVSQTDSVFRSQPDTLFRTVRDNATAMSEMLTAQAEPRDGARGYQRELFPRRYSGAWRRSDQD